MGEIVILAFAALLAAAAVSDALTLTIPNRLNLAIVGLFGVAVALAALPLAVVGAHLASGLGMLALCFGLFAAGWIGGGDAKLAAAVALWIGPAHLFEWSIFTAASGAVLTLLILALRRAPLPLALAGRPWIARLTERTTGVPYGVAISLAGLVMLPKLELFAMLALR